MAEALRFISIEAVSLSRCWQNHLVAVRFVRTFHNHIVQITPNNRNDCGPFEQPSGFVSLLQGKFIGIYLHFDIGHIHEFNLNGRNKMRLISMYLADG